jgi:uncharacterized protein (DUF1800 family)
MSRVQCGVRLGLLGWVAWILATGGGNALALDTNANGQSDVWEVVFGARNLAALSDADGDGVTNADESAAGTDPLSAASWPRLEAVRRADGSVRLEWLGVVGKQYRLEQRSALASGDWATLTTEVGEGHMVSVPAGSIEAEAQFFRLRISDPDTDGDGLSDWEERLVGFDPRTAHTAWNETTDLVRVQALLNAPNEVTVGVVDAEVSERWPDPGVFAVRRKGGIQPLTVTFALGGTATEGVDFTSSAVGTVRIPAGAREVWVEIRPRADADDAEADETVSLTLTGAAGYTVGAKSTAQLVLRNEPLGAGPSVKAAARFLLQAGFGPSADDPLDADEIPENVEEVQQLGFEGWLQDQFAREPGFHRPIAEWLQDTNNVTEFYADVKSGAWWHRMLGLPQRLPQGPADFQPDILRQRVAFALSQIFVVSDRPEVLSTEPVGMTDYHDVLVRHAFGNFRDLLQDVARHPVMGFYLSHLLNRKLDPVAGIHPDENFAREIMQLFSIGLWELNPDGTRRLGADGAPIPTYDNRTVTELARVFTGFGMAGNPQFSQFPRNFSAPMRMFDEWHDLGAKTFLGLQLPARTATTDGTAGEADVTAAVDHLAAHPNVGPFIGRLLIQRLVTSNPGTGYVARVAAAFADNGAGVRGDLKSVVRAILLDPEARDGNRMEDPAAGRLREPLLRVVNVARAFDASSTSGLLPLSNFYMDHVQEAYQSPSVFNFFLPTYAPPGPLAEAGLVAPEMQIVNASSLISAANYFSQLASPTQSDLNRWGTGDPTRATRLHLSHEVALVAGPEALEDPAPNREPLDPDVLLRRLDLQLTGGTLRPEQFQILREAMERLRFPTWEWHRDRVRLAVALIVNSPDFSVIR